MPPQTLCLGRQLPQSKGRDSMNKSAYRSKCLKMLSRVIFCTRNTMNASAWVSLCLVLVLTILGSIALFAVVQNARLYVEDVEGHFYTPVAKSSETALDRAFSSTALRTLRFALWPAVVFTLFEIGASYFIFRLLHLEGRFTTTRRMLASFGVSVLTTIVLLVPTWWLLQKLTNQVDP